MQTSGRLRRSPSVSSAADAQFARPHPPRIDRLDDMDALHADRAGGLDVLGAHVDEDAILRGEILALEQNLVDRRGRLDDAFRSPPLRLSFVRPVPQPPRAEVAYDQGPARTVNPSGCAQWDPWLYGSCCRPYLHDDKEARPSPGLDHGCFGRHRLLGFSLCRGSAACECGQARRHRSHRHALRRSPDANFVGPADCSCLAARSGTCCCDRSRRPSGCRVGGRDLCRCDDQPAFLI